LAPPGIIGLRPRGAGVRHDVPDRSIWRFNVGSLEFSCTSMWTAFVRGRSFIANAAGKGNPIADVVVVVVVVVVRANAVAWSTPPDESRSSSMSSSS
jgi:hypothetical protein